MFKIGLMKTLGTRIAHFRKLAGLTQGDLAKRCGWASQSRVGNYESDSREPTIGDLKLIAAAVGVKFVELIAEEDARQSESKSKESNVIAADFSSKPERGLTASGDLIIPHYDVRAAMGAGQVVTDRCGECSCFDEGCFHAAKYRQFDHPSTTARPRQSTSTILSQNKNTFRVDIRNTLRDIYSQASHTGPGQAPTFFNTQGTLSRPDTGPYPAVSGEEKRRPAVRTSARWHSGPPYAGGEQAEMATARGVAPGA